MSLRFRLTVLYSAILALTLVAFGILLYLTVAQATIRVLGNTLADEAQRLLDEKVVLYPHIVVIPASTFAAPETFVQTRNLSGRVIDRTPNLGDVELPLPAPGLQAVRSGENWLAIETIGGSHVLIYSKPIDVDGRNTGIVQVARSLDAQDQALRTLKQILIIASSVATILAFGAGWLMAGLALSPISRITQTAQAIEAEHDFNRRVEYRGPNDEVGRLATTFNGMLQALQAAYRQAEQALLAQRRFVADASHELRTPLTTIRGNAELLRRVPPISVDDQTAVLADIVGESERMIQLVNDLLMLARADSGRKLRHEPVQVKPLLEDLCRTTRLLNPERAISCDEVVDAAVLSDRDTLKEVLLILLDNALKYTPVTGTIRLMAKMNDQTVVVSVRDTGPGIDPTRLPLIFERFYRGDPARSGNGAGLGLAIAKALVEAMGGALGVESQVGAGTTFIVRLPVADRLETESQPAAIALAEHSVARR